MKKIQAVLIIIITFCAFKAKAQSTQKVYLSGRGKNNTVTWKFYCTAGRKSGKWTTIPVPSCWELQGFGHYNYGLDWEDHERKVGHEKGLYKYTFRVPASWKGKKVNIVFDGVMTDAKVKINGKLAGPIHQGAFYKFKYDISDLLHYGAKNLLQVTVSKVSSNKSVNAAEREADYWIFGGIFRPVYLEAKPKENIKRVAIDAKANGAFSANVFISGGGDGASIAGQVETLGGKKVGKSFKTQMNTNLNHQTLTTKLSHIKTWSPEFPNLYKVKFTLLDSKGHVIHEIKRRFGFRTVKLVKHDGLYINGKKIRFRGVDYHAFWPSSGRTVSKALDIKDVKLMKDMNMNAVRLSHYPRDKDFYDVCDSLGLFVLDELTGWQDSYDTKVGSKLVKEMVTNDVNHPSIVIWDNGNEGGYNFDLDSEFTKYDPQNRPVNHPGGIFKGINTEHYKPYDCCTETLFHGDNVFFPDEILHGLYDGGGGAGLHDYWNLMRNNPLSAGGFIWEYMDQCVERTDKGDSLDCDGNHGPDGIVGPYRRKSGSFYAIKEIWSPVHIQRKNITAHWDEQLTVGNRFFYTNLDQVHFKWKLVNYPGPFSKKQKNEVIEKGIIKSPDIKPQHKGVLQLNLPTSWKQADALSVRAVGPHGREIDKWTWPIKKQPYWVNKTVRDTSKTTSHVKQTDKTYVLASGAVTVSINKKNGYITGIHKNGKSYSLTDGPYIVGDSSSLKTISANGNEIKANFSSDDYKVTYSLTEGWLKISYSFRPRGKYPYFGISFHYPEKKVQGIKWLGDGPDRVWKNRLAGMKYGLWNKKYRDNPPETIHDYQWQYPKFNGYYANLNWAVLNTSEGDITMMAEHPGIYLGLFRPVTPPNPKNAVAVYPNGDLSFLNAISPIGTKFHKPAALGPEGQPNIFEYPFPGKRAFTFNNTLWFYFGKQNL